MPLARRKDKHPGGRWQGTEHKKKIEISSPESTAFRSANSSIRQRPSFPIMDPNFPNFSIDPFSICRSLSLPSLSLTIPAHRHSFSNSLQTQFESFLRNRSKSGLVLNFFRSNFSHINLSFCHQPPAAPSVINPRLGSILLPRSSSQQRLQPCNPRKTSAWYHNFQSSLQSAAASPATQTTPLHISFPPNPVRFPRGDPPASPRPVNAFLAFHKQPSPHHPPGSCRIRRVGGC